MVDVVLVDGDANIPCVLPIGSDRDRVLFLRVCLRCSTCSLLTYFTSKSSTRSMPLMLPITRHTFALEVAVLVEALCEQLVG